MSHPYVSVILRVRELLNHSWKVEVRHAYRDANPAADALAALGHSHQIGVTYFITCPASFIVAGLFAPIPRQKNYILKYKLYTFYIY